MVDMVKKSMGGTSPITSNPDKPDPLPGSHPTSLHPQAAKVRPSWQVSDVRGISTCLTMQSSRLKSDHFLVSLFSSSSLLLPSVRCPSKVVVLYFFCWSRLPTTCTEAATLASLGSWANRYTRWNIYTVFRTYI